MTQPTLEAAQAKIDGLAREYFSDSDYELFCAVLLQLDKYKALADSNREAMFIQDKEFSQHAEIQQAEIDSLRRSVDYWQRKCTLLFVENDRLVKESEEGAEHGGGNTNGAVSKCK
ncbi:hypothetical protein HW560_15640 [Paenibacillus sp. E222]|uniref:hypothetical protein n=1 Tax=Paenibacillus sp. E222 TaxID=2748863 RepID=UPI0015C61400|nr:hypothetical protein [Paenibacillus sp. E222]QLG39381.1 hypothetical protein HW560_15640 [Paenibacillus sp. E222]